MVLHITVKTLDSHNFLFHAEDDWTVRQFKEHIRATVGVVEEEQRLIFCGRVLQDDKKLTEYNCNEKVIHLVRRPPPQLGEANRASDSNNNSQATTNPSGHPESIRISRNEGVFFNTAPLRPDLSLNQVLRTVAVTLQRAFGDSGVPIPSGTSIGLTISPQYVPAPVSASTSRAHQQRAANVSHTTSQPRPQPELQPQSSRGASRQSLSHPEWLPIIEADIDRMERQNRNKPAPPYFSDAYLSSVPKKRRRLLSANMERVPILQPSSAQAVSSLLRRAIRNSEAHHVEPIDTILESLSSNADILSSYEEYLNDSVAARLKRDEDYKPEKFVNCSKYFK